MVQQATRANQMKILKNQGAILRALQRVLANQHSILANQGKILRRGRA